MSAILLLGVLTLTFRSVPSARQLPWKRLSRSAELPPRMRDGSSRQPTHCMLPLYTLPIQGHPCPCPKHIPVSQQKKLKLENASSAPELPPTHLPPTPTPGTHPTPHNVHPTSALPPHSHPTSPHPTYNAPLNHPTLKRRRSLLLTTYHLLLATCYLLLTTDDLLLATRYLPLATRYLLFVRTAYC